MASEVKTRSKRQDRPLEAPTLDSGRVPPAVREKLIHPDPAPLHEVPKDPTAEAALARVETLLGKGQFGAALREIEALKPGDATLAGRYAFIRQEKLSRAQIGIADRYFLRGDKAKARAFYDRALRLDGAGTELRQVADAAVKAFDDLAKRRRALIDGLKQDIRKGNFAQWCGRKKTLADLTLLDVDVVRKRIDPDFRLEPLFGERPPIHPSPGWLDPLPVESESVAFVSAVPGAVFRARTDAAVDVDTLPAAGAADTGKVRASLAMPVVANVLIAKARLFALDQGLSVTGQAEGVVPLFRYEHLRDKAKELIAHIQGIESRMLPIQFELDDFAEATDAIRRPLVTQQAELEAVKQRIVELTQALAQLAQIEKAVAEAVDAIAKVEDECECDWFCWLVTIGGMVFIAATVFAATVALAAGTGGTLAPILIGALAGAIIDVGIISWAVITIDAFTCQNVATVGRQMRAALTGVRGAIADSEAELSHALMTRDSLIASINALAHQLEEAYQSNAARVLDAKTLDAIQSQYNHLRQSLLTRAQAVARQAQDAFNFERDTQAALIRDSYADPDRKGYTAAESLLHDLDGLDHIDLTGRTQKAMQLSHMVSLQRHQPISFLALKAIGSARFTTSLEDFDRYYPGTYLQRIKEVRVEVLVDGEVVLARGYISNDGVSLVRFADSEGRRSVDDIRVFAEPDPDIARLCYKRLQRRRHADTMAFPAFSSYLHEDRMRHIQQRERNFFENVGLESTWTIEFLPDQPFDLARVSDVRVWFQYEALFDENLKRIVDKKRFAGRRAMARLPVATLVRERGEVADFAGPLTVRSTAAMFEAPAVSKTIVNVGLGIRLKGARPLGGAAAIEVSFEGAAPVTVTTNSDGIAATAPDHPAGAGLAALEAMTHGKSVQGAWTLRIKTLPSGIDTEDVDELFLLLHCEYAAA